MTTMFERADTRIIVREKAESIIKLCDRCAPFDKIRDLHEQMSRQLNGLDAASTETSEIA